MEEECGICKRSYLYYVGDPPHECDQADIAARIERLEQEFDEVLPTLYEVRAISIPFSIQIDSETESDSGRCGLTWLTALVRLVIAIRVVLAVRSVVRWIKR